MLPAMNALTNRAVLSGRRVYSDVMLGLEQLGVLLIGCGVHGDAFVGDTTREIWAEQHGADGLSRRATLLHCR